MDPVSLSTGLAQSAVSSQVGVSVLKSLQNLDKSLAAELFGSIGLGTNVNALA